MIMNLSDETVDLIYGGLALASRRLMNEAKANRQDGLARVADKQEREAIEYDRVRAILSSFDPRA